MESQDELEKNIEINMRYKECNQMIKDYEQKLKIHPYDDQVYFNLATLQLKLSLYQEAIQNFKESIKLDDKNPIPLKYLGFIYKKLQNYEQSFYYYLKAIEIQPLIQAGYKNLSSLLSLLENLNHPSLNKILRNMERNCKQYYILGQSYFFGNNLQKAQFFLKKAININPNFQLAYNRLKQVYIKQKKTQLATKIQKVHGKKPDSQKETINEAKHCQWKKQFQKAYNLYNKVEKINPFNTEVINLKNNLKKMIQIQQEQQLQIEQKTFNSINTQNCLGCLTNEKNCVCVPCGHISFCFNCAQLLNDCPICHKKMKVYKVYF